MNNDERMKKTQEQIDALDAQAMSLYPGLITQIILLTDLPYSQVESMITYIAKHDPMGARPYIIAEYIREFLYMMKHPQP